MNFRDHCAWFGRCLPALVSLALTLGLAATASAADMIGNCEVTGQKGAFPITPVQPGQLTVDVNLPAPGWWNGDTPETIKDGFEYCMAANIAYRAGLDKIAVTNVTWDSLVAGQTENFDLALSEVSITDERKKVVNFSVPYFHSDTGILVRKDANFDSKSMKGLRFGVQQATTAFDFLNNKLKPTEQVMVFQDIPSLLASLAAGQIDVGMSDTSYVLALATQSKGALKVIGQYSTGETYGAIYPKDSANAATFDKIIQSLIDDGTLKALSAKYLAAAWGADPTTIPYFEVEP